MSAARTRPVLQVTISRPAMDAVTAAAAARGITLSAYMEMLIRAMVLPPVVKP